MYSWGETDFLTTSKVFTRSHISAATVTSCPRHHTWHMPVVDDERTDSFVILKMNIAGMFKRLIAILKRKFEL